MDERVKNLPAMWETLEKGMATYPVFLNGELHAQRSLADYSPWDHKESDTTEGPAIFGFIFLKTNSLPRYEKHICLTSNMDGGGG